MAQGTFVFVTSRVGDGPYVLDACGVRLDTRFLGQIYAGPDANNLHAAGQPEQFGLFNGAPNAATNGLILRSAEVTVNNVLANS